MTAFKKTLPYKKSIRQRWFRFLVVVGVPMTVAYLAIYHLLRIPKLIWDDFRLALPSIREDWNA